MEITIYGIPITQIIYLSFIGAGALHFLVMILDRGSQLIRYFLYSKIIFVKIERILPVDYRLSRGWNCLLMKEEYQAQFLYSVQGIQYKVIYPFAREKNAWNLQKTMELHYHPDKPWKYAIGDYYLLINTMLRLGIDLVLVILCFVLFMEGC